MAFLHCHSCGWSQDDFYDIELAVKYHRWRKSWWKFGISFGYNPITKIWNDIKWLWKPRWIFLDDWILFDIMRYTGIKVNVEWMESGRSRVFSWDWLVVEIVKDWKVFREMKWWTYNSWKRDRDNAVCPKCGKRAFDID